MMDMQLAEAAAMMQQHPELNTMENRNMLQRLGRHIAGGGPPPGPGLEVKKEGDGTPYTLTIQDKDDRGFGTPQPFVVLTSKGRVENYTLEARAAKAIYAIYPIAVAEFLRITFQRTSPFGFDDDSVYLKLMPGAKLPVLADISGDNGFITFAVAAFDAGADIGDRQIVKDDDNNYKIQVNGKLDEELDKSLQDWLVMHNMYAPPAQLGNVYNLGEEERKNLGEDEQYEY